MAAPLDVGPRSPLDMGSIAQNRHLRASVACQKEDRASPHSRSGALHLCVLCGSVVNLLPSLPTPFPAGHGVHRSESIPALPLTSGALPFILCERSFT